MPSGAELQNVPLLRTTCWIALIFLGFLTHTFTHMPVAVPAVIGIAAILFAQDYYYLKDHKPTHEERQHGVLAILEKDIEWPTLAFFLFLFILVGAAVATGLIESLARASPGPSARYRAGPASHRGRRCWSRHCSSSGSRASCRP